MAAHQPALTRYLAVCSAKHQAASSSRHFCTKAGLPGMQVRFNAERCHKAQAIQEAAKYAVLDDLAAREPVPGVLSLQFLQ